MTLASPLGGAHINVSFETDNKMPVTDISFGFDVGAKASFILYEQFDLPSLAGLDFNLDLGAITLNSDMGITLPVLGPVGIAGSINAAIDISALKDINNFKGLTNLDANLGVEVFGFDVGGGVNMDVSMKKTFDSMTIGLEKMNNSIENYYKSFNLNLPR